MTIETRQLFHLAGYASFSAGVIRIVTGFIPFVPETLWLEVLYGFVDILLLFSIMAFYTLHQNRLGLVGLLGFIVSTIGIASIVGPDAIQFGINFYEVGALTMVLGLSILSIAMIVERINRPAALCWIGALFTAVLGSLLSVPEFYVLSGIVFGLGFCFAGVQLLKS